MTVRVGINGFGRIGRNFYRALLAQQAEGAGTDIEDVFDLAAQGRRNLGDRRFGTNEVEGEDGRHQRAEELRDLLR